MSLSYSFEPLSPPPSSAPPPPPRRSRWWTCLSVVGLIVVVAMSAGLGAGGGYLLARREFAAQANASPAALPQTMSIKQDSAVIDAVRKVKPAVVTVVNTLQPQVVAPQGFFFGFGQNRQQEAKASGSGVIIDNRGHIITNFHVVDKAARLEIIFADGTKAQNPATLVGVDQYNDLAVLRVELPIPAYAELGDSSQLQQGETIVAIGSPLGEFRGSVTVGVVSAINRTLDVNQNLSLEGLIQTDAAINQGNSGGPLVNLAGQVVGINTAIVRSDPSTARFRVSANEVAEGLGFAIPSATVRDVASQIITTGRVEYPYLGVRYQEITPALAAAYNLPVRHGLFVQDVERGSPAAVAGIQRGDIVADIDGVPLDEDHPLFNVLMKRKVGDEVSVTVYRNGQKLAVKVKLAGR